MFERRSALVTQLNAAGRNARDGRRAVRVGEVSGWNLAQLGVFAGQQGQLAAAVAAVLGAELLPPAPARWHAAPPALSTGRRLMPTGWWRAIAAVISRLHAAVPVSAGTVTSLSHSRVRCSLAGPGRARGAGRRHLDRSAPAAASRWARSRRPACTTPACCWSAARRIAYELSRAAHVCAVAVGLAARCGAAVRLRHRAASRPQCLEASLPRRRRRAGRNGH